MIDKSMTIAQIVDLLELEDHPEGGYFREFYRSQDIIDTARGPHSKQTVIYYCLPAAGAWEWHLLIDLEETMRFHGGEPTDIYMIENGKIVTYQLSDEDSGNETVVIPPNTWFAMKSLGLEGTFTVMTASVEPGFEYEDMLTGDPSILDLLDAQDHQMARTLLKTNP